MVGHQKGQQEGRAFHNVEILRAIECGSPAFIEGPMKDRREAKEGATTPLFDNQGRVVKLTTGETAFQKVGPIKRR